uniref:Uncharacterized protein n=1 Tax=Oryza sativa subsp. japonica TaxID=39947 RepID=Q2R439_ORYSJ|nr:hypothetical protein LOC_Os11g29800 [Oryza sativa Japonica Group]
MASSSCRGQLVFSVDPIRNPFWKVEIINFQLNMRQPAAQLRLPAGMRGYSVAAEEGRTRQKQYCSLLQRIMVK